MLSISAKAKLLFVKSLCLINIQTVIYKIIGEFNYAQSNLSGNF